MIAVHLGLLGAFVFTFWWLPMELFGLGSFYSVLGALIVLIAVAAGLTYLSLFLLDIVTKWGYDRPEKVKHHKHKEHKKSKTFKFGSAIIQWLKDVDEGICRNITVKERTTK